MCARLFHVCSLFLCLVICSGDVDAQTAAVPAASSGGPPAASAPASGPPAGTTAPPTTAPAAVTAPPVAPVAAPTTPVSAPAATPVAAPATAPASADVPLITIPAGVDPYVLLGVIIEDLGEELVTINSQERYLYNSAEASKDSGQKKALLEKWARIRARQSLLSRIVNDARKQRREMLRVDEVVAGASVKLLMKPDRE